MACRCSCCEKTGACCVDGVCSQQTCSDCNDLGGEFQGVDTECTGEGEDECPCDPPADPTLCEKCVDGEAESYCPESKPYCCDGVCEEEPCCDVGCDEEGQCPEGCECCTSATPGSPGSLVTGCLPISADYACCCEAYKKLCYTDESYCVPLAHSGLFPPNISGSPPAGAILLNNTDALYCDVNREIGGFWDLDENNEEVACYDYGYYTAAGDCDDCDGDCDDWFDTGSFSPSFWQLFCDCATSNAVDVCEANPLP